MPERCPPSRRDQRNDETNLRSDHDGKMTGPSLVETVSAKRYKILETVGVDNFKAHGPRAESNRNGQKEGQAKRWFKPVNASSDAANGIPAVACKARRRSTPAKACFTS
jgi:hypothetical protein